VEEMRNFIKRRYVIAFVITLAIFFIGFFFGFIMDINRVNYFETMNDVNKLNIRSLQLQEELVNDEFKEECKAFRFMFDKSVVELENDRQRLEDYKRQAKIKDSDFELLRREYTLSQINLWKISKKLIKSCPNTSDFVPIIYFYSDNKNCPMCDNQATVLNYYKQNLKENLLIFALDEKQDYQEPLIAFLKSAYEIQSYPTIIVIDTPYQKYINKDELGKILCDLYSSVDVKKKICV
jgi:hypothetical protein